MNPKDSLEMCITSDNNLERLKQLAVFFIKKAEQENKNVDKWKLQKLAYYAQWWALAILNKRLIEFDIQARMNGPVIPLLRDIYNSRLRELESSNFDDTLFTEEELQLLEEVWTGYWRSYSSEQLIEKTHGELPRKKAREGYGDTDRSTVVIPDSDLFSFFSQIPEDSIEINKFSIEFIKDNEEEIREMKEAWSSKLLG